MEDSDIGRDGYASGRTYPTSIVQVIHFQLGKNEIPASAAKGVGLKLRVPSLSNEATELEPWKMESDMVYNSNLASKCMIFLSLGEILGTLVCDISTLSVWMNES